MSDQEISTGIDLKTGIVMAAIIIVAVFILRVVRNILLSIAWKISRRKSA